LSIVARSPFWADVRVTEPKGTPSSAPGMFSLLLGAFFRAQKGAQKGSVAPTIEPWQR